MGGNKLYSRRVSHSIVNYHVNYVYQLGSVEHNDNGQQTSILLKPKKVTSLWFQPVWKILVKKGIFPKVGVKII